MNVNTFIHDYRYPIMNHKLTISYDGVRRLTWLSHSSQVFSQNTELVFCPWFTTEYEIGTGCLIIVGKMLPNKLLQSITKCNIL